MDSSRLVLFFCRLGPAGRSPWAPGTCGTFEALVLAPFLFLPLGLAGRLFLLAVLFVAGSLAATRAEELLQRKDPGEVVIDELVGAWIAILPFAFSWTLMLCAFVLFRFFDILKPWPVKASENWLPAGWGVLVDDVVGGVMAMICLCLLKAAGVFAFSWL